MRAIVTFDGELKEAAAPLSVCLTLDDEIDVSRGDMLVAQMQPASIARSFTASLVWMDAQPLARAKRYLLKHASRTVHASVRAVRYSVDVSDLRRSAATTLAMNAIGLVEIETAQPLAVDLYAANRQTGSFVLIDAETNATIAAGMVREVLEDNVFSATRAPVLAEERARRWGHVGAHLALTGSSAFADAVERRLLEAGLVAVRCGATDTRLQQALVGAGVLALTLMPSPSGFAQARVGRYATAAMTDHPATFAGLGGAVLALLRESAVLRPSVASDVSGGNR